MNSSYPLSNQRIKFVGCATSHFQSEPILYNSAGEKVHPVSDWENELAKNLKRQKSCIKIPQLESELPKFSRKAELYIKRSRELGHNMFRFSFDFGRLCPVAGEFNEKMMEDYIYILALVKAYDQEPMVTLHHFTMPEFLTLKDNSGKVISGAWDNNDVLKHIKFYVTNIVKSLSNKDKVKAILDKIGFDQIEKEKLINDGLVKYFLSINEPLITLINSYIIGRYPPFRKGHFWNVNKILSNMVQAHDVLFSEIKNLCKAIPNMTEPQVGIGYNWQYYDGPLKVLARELIDKYHTAKFERDGSFTDFIGINYYYRQTIPFLFKKWKGRDYSDMPSFGDVYPSGILEVLRQMNVTYPTKQLFITEIGFSESKDLRRPYWLLETIKFIFNAQSEGIPIIGILLWSMVNNLEWEMGTGQKFGMFSETELEMNLESNKEKIRTWEVWKVAIESIISSSETSKQKLQDAYDRAKKQYEKYK